MTYAEYLAVEEAADTKHEYVDGRVVAMAGGTLEHSRLQGEVAYQLRRQLESSGCRVLTSDARVRIESTNSARYPDVSVVCREVERAVDDPEGLANPTLLVEVLSPSTERSDRGEKFAHYKHIASLQEYVLVAQDDARIEVFRRTDDGWLLNEAGPGQSLELRSIDATLDVDALYRDRIES
jgi:Uma2 family endonuclease